MKEETLGLVIVGGIVGAGVLVWALTRNAYAAPPVQTPTDTGGDGVIPGPNFILQAGTSPQVDVPVTSTMTIGIPTGATWTSLTGPNGSIPVAGSAAVGVGAVTGTFTGSWTLNGVVQSGSIIVTAQAPPSGV
jgi:hypothetical protein